MDHPHIIIGGGTYGCFTALRLAERFGGDRVLVVEQEADLMLRASYNNQARVHGGYHYPRSVLTALRSRVNAPRFLAEFAEAIHSDFQQIYAIGRRQSNVTAGQFEQFCRRIGADVGRARPEVAQLFDEEFIEAVFCVSEPVFDADKLRACLRQRMAERGVTVLTRTQAMRIAIECAGGDAGQRLHLDIRDEASGASRTLVCQYAYNCTYSRLNEVLARSGLATIHLRHEATEMALIEPPPALRNVGITVMCGPFFSVMPFPSTPLATFSHVSYTPHYEWTDEPSGDGYNPHQPAFPLRTRFDRMRRDAARYVPAMRDCAYVRSLWEVKTVLPQSGVNDSRPILFKRDPAAPNLISLLGSKIDNIFDLDEALPAADDRRPGANDRRVR
jgi:glycine/D-amino acid oxidase-like deaminating enzyme